MKRLYAYFFLLYTIAVLPALAQNTQEQFGQNRVQYKDFEWSFYETENFNTYFYLGGQDIGKFVIKAAEENLQEVQRKLEYRIDEKIEILVYNDLSDLWQTNIGVNLEQYNTGGTTKIIGNRIFVYFNGDHNHLIRQIREGIAKVLIRHMIFGGNIQDVVQNAVLLNLPQWYTEGLIAYAGEEWNTELDNRLRDGILSGEYRKFNKLSSRSPKFAGHAIWYYISEKYGPNAISNILYLTRINRSMESGFLYVLGKSVNETVKDWYNYFHRKYSLEKNIRYLPGEKQLIPVRTKKKNHYSQLKMHPEGKYIAYVSNHLGKYKVYIENLETGKRKKVLKGGFKTISLPINYNFPIITWNPLGDELAIIYNKRDQLQLITYNLENNDKTKEDITKFQNITDARYMNPKTLILSAVNRGQSDIYTYHLASNRTQQITNDFYDDLQPAYIDIEGKKGILFISNRKSDTLKSIRLDTIMPDEDFDLFFYDLDKKSDILVRITNSDLFMESMPMPYNNTHFSYLSNKNGIRNRFAAYFDTTFSHYDTIAYFNDTTITNPKPSVDSFAIKGSYTIDSISLREVFKDTAISFPVTNYSRNITEQDIPRKSDHIAELIRNGAEWKFYHMKVNKSISKKDAMHDLDPTFYRSQTLSNKSAASSKKDTATRKQKSEMKIDIENYLFQNEVDVDIEKGKNDTTVIQEDSKEEDRSKFRLSRVRPYRLKFMVDEIVSQLDNSIMFTEYQKFAGGGAVFNNPPISSLIKIGVTDLMEDYKIWGGLRIPTNFSSREYFIRFENLKSRLDKKLLLYRKSVLTSRDLSPAIPGSVLTRDKLNYAELKLTWPFDILRSIRGYAGYRNDRVEFLATIFQTLELPPVNEHWGTVGLEYVFDNTIPLALNILEGTRYKVFAEIRQRADELDDRMGLLGADIRHYEPIHREIIWANRISTQTSFGPDPIIYYLGGVDNWLIPRFNRNIPINQDVDYAYQALATNLRGFRQNIRNGSSYALFNSELRIPLFSYLINKPIRSGFIRNFQLVGFADIGTAWENIFPDRDNAFSKDVIIKDPLEIRVKYFQNPVVGGYGLGARTVLFGYFLRADVAWGYDEGLKGKPIWYLSTSLDF